MKAFHDSLIFLCFADLARRAAVALQVAQKRVAREAEVREAQSLAADQEVVAEAHARNDLAVITVDHQLQNDQEVTIRAVVIQAQGKIIYFTCVTIFSI